MTPSKILTGGLALLLLALALAPAPAAAKSRIPAADRAAAKAHFKAARELYRTSLYEEALARFNKAHQLDPQPEFLFNIARCNEVLARLELAIKHYEHYLAAMPRAKNRALVETRLASLKARLAKQKQPKAPPEPKKAAPVEAAPATRPEVSAPSDWRWPAGWAAVGVGGALVITGVVLGVMASGKTDEYNQAAADKKHYSELQDIESSGKALEAAQIATLVVGGVAAAAGAGLLTWSLLGGSDDERAALKLAPYASGLGGGVVLGGRF